jgi:hypothetical protein
VLFAGDDWAQDHHDIEIADDGGRRLARARLPEGLEGVSRLHALIGEHAPPEWAELEPGRAASLVKVAIETGREPWVAALVAAGYEVFAVNPVPVARYRGRHSTSRAKSDAGDAHVLAEIARLDRVHHRPVAADSALAEAVKLVARTHQTLIWDRSRQLLRLRSALREFFPAALKAFAGLAAPDALELLGRAPGPGRAAQLPHAKITAALQRANRRGPATKATQIQGILRAPALRQPPAAESAYATIVAGRIRLIAALNGEIGEVVASHFGRHPTLTSTLASPDLARTRRSGSRRVRRCPKSVRRCEGAQELRRDLPDHPRLGPEEDRAGPLHPQPPARRCRAPMGILRAPRLTRRPRLP